jgi:Ca-activated chloride channel homolog
MLKGGNFTGTVSYDDVIALATKAKGDDPFGLRAEFVNLVRLAKSVK